MEIEGPTATATPSQPVLFTTQTAYPFPSQKFLIPATWMRYHLSQLINKALSLPNVVPFDFLLRGEILRTTLGQWCAEHGVGEEETLEIEYIESVMPPQKLSDFPHDDWVSSVSCQIHAHFVTGSYDGVVRIFDYSRTLTTSAKLHNAPVTSVATIPYPSDPISVENPTTQIIATASHDLTALLTRFTLDSQPHESLDEQESGKPASIKATPLTALCLHTSPLASIAVNNAGTHLLTASWDSLIGVWDTRIPSEHETSDVRAPAPSERTRKKRKIADDGADDAADGAANGGPPNGGQSATPAAVETTNVKRKAPITVMKSHTARVSSALFGSENRGLERFKAYSCSFDSTVRVWDVEMGLCEHTINASEKPFTSLALPDAHLALATSTDRTMVLYDTRIPTSAAPATPPSSFMHPATPSCIALPSYPAPSSSTPGKVNQVVTGAYDGIVRVWDLRSTKSAVSSFDAFGSARDKDSKKILGVDWNAERGVVGAGGEAGFVVWSFKEDVKTQ